MKNFLVITLLSLLSYNFSIAESDLSKVYKEYKIDTKILKITNNGFLDEVWLCSSTNKDCELINRHFSFIDLAIECENVKQKIIYFAVNKEHFFMGGINENAPLRIYDLKGNVYGSAPNIDYAREFCKFY
tara:strand:+ start:164 stop:553 length:390 start_codon:yes stop_codon:yes gene_type:complete